PTSPALRFCVLGPVRAWAGDRELALGPLKQRRVLAMLLCRAGNAVSLDALTEAVWEKDAPRTARKNLQLYVFGIRRVLAEAGAEDRLVLQPGGYRLRVAEHELDSLRLAALARQGHDAAVGGNAERAARILRQAKDLRVGSPLGELAASDSLRAEADRLELRHLAACEDWAEAALEAGPAEEVAEATQDLIERHPLRERLRSAHMTALHRAGRRAEALAAYDELRKLLARELGISPSPAFEAAYRAILADENGRDRMRAHRRVPGVRLPAETEEFTGRADIVAELSEAVSHSGSLTLLVGQPGAGKTALALRAARRLGSEFPDGMVIVRLRERDGSARPLTSTVAELLAYTDEPERSCADPEREAARWRTWSAGRRVLLILDDAPDEATVRTLFPGGRSSALVTARGQLAGLSPTRRIQVTPLPADEALDFLTTVAGPGRVRSDPASAERIVASCGGIPLAIRAAGLKLVVLPHLRLAEYAARLAEPDTVLDHLEVGDLQVRAQAARGWRDLRPSHAAVLLSLARLEPSARFAATDAAALTGIAPDRLCIELESMIEKGALVSPPTGAEPADRSATYSLPYLTHLYARSTAARG
ncbi:winged helix-turn-helix domain-containing protein, partial [Actinospica durhamensis]